MKLICYSLLTTIVFASGGFDHGTSAGKNKWDLSFTWNPYNYFKNGQSYLILSYGITKNLDFHSYYSYSRQDDQNYYFGLFNQFIRTKTIDVATAIGIRAYSKNSIKHLFFPQLLYTLHLTNNIRLGGSFVNILSQEKLSFEGTSIDVFLMYKVYENKKIKIDLSLGGFKPVTWTPYSGDWYPTYSVDIKIKN